MAKSKGTLTPEQIVAQSPHALEGNEPFTGHVYESDPRGTKVPKKNTASGDPALQPIEARRQVINENIGAAYKGIPMGLNKPVDPTAGPTQYQGRTLPPKISREGAFTDGGRY